MKWFKRRGERRAAPPATRLSVVYDTGGAGRVVGVFDDDARARAVVSANPAYYRLTACELNAVTPAALEWAAPDVRARLSR
jgi:hypothetical protein